MSSDTRIKVTIPDVKALLDQGKTRKEIAEYYGVPMSVMKIKVWSHPDLKNLKAKKQYDIELIDDAGCTTTCPSSTHTSENTIGSTAYQDVNGSTTTSTEDSSADSSHSEAWTESPETPEVSNEYPAGTPVPQEATEPTASEGKGWSRNGHTGL